MRQVILYFSKFDDIKVVWLVKGTMSAQRWMLVRVMSLKRFWCTLSQPIQIFHIQCLSAVSVCVCVSVTMFVALSSSSMLELRYL